MTQAERVANDKQLEKTMSDCLSRNHIDNTAKAMFTHIRVCETCTYCTDQRKALKALRKQK